VESEIVIEQTETRDGYYEFAPDVYDAVIVNIKKVDNPFEEGKKQLEFTFEIPGYYFEDGSVALKRAWANAVWNRRSKLWSWATAILGAEPAKGEPFRTSSLIGKPCRVTMNVVTTQKGERVVKITDVLGAKATTNTHDDMADAQETCRDCDQPATQYTTRGTPFCDAHAP